jgi:hypothetical protein
MAVRTNSAAGRACRSTLPGSATRTSAIVVSELACTTGPLRRSRYLGQLTSGRRDDSRRDRSLNQRSIDQPSVPVTLPLEDVADRQDCASEITEHNHTITLIGPADRLSHQPVVSANSATGTSAGDLDSNVRTRHLAG